MFNSDDRFQLFCAPYTYARFYWAMVRIVVFSLSLLFLPSYQNPNLKLCDDRAVRTDECQTFHMCIWDPSVDMCAFSLFHLSHGWRA